MTDDAAGESTAAQNACGGAASAGASGRLWVWRHLLLVCCLRRRTYSSHGGAQERAAAERSTSELAQSTHATRSQSGRPRGRPRRNHPQRSRVASPQPSLSLHHLHSSPRSSSAAVAPSTAVAPLRRPPLPVPPSPGCVAEMPRHKPRLGAALVRCAAHASVRPSCVARYLCVARPSCAARGRCALRGPRVLRGPLPPSVYEEVHFAPPLTLSLVVALVVAAQ